MCCNSTCSDGMGGICRSGPSSGAYCSKRVVHIQVSQECCVPYGSHVQFEWGGIEYARTQKTVPLK